MKIRARVGSGVRMYLSSCVLLSGTATFALAAPPTEKPLAKPPAKSPAKAAATAPAAASAAPSPSPAEADRISTASVTELVAHHRRGYDLTYVARTTMSRDLPAWRTSAGKNRPAGQLMLGLCNYYGLGGAHNAPRGRELVLAAARAGNAEAMAVLSILIRNGNLESRPDVDEANGWLGKALAAKSRIARDEVALSAAKELLIEGKTRDAMEAYDTSIKAGSLGGRVALAGIMRRGWLAPYSLEESLKQLEMAAGEGHIGAMVELGNIHAHGRYLKHDPSKARRWLDAAAATGDPRGLASAALAYERGGMGEPHGQDMERANKLWARLEANGDPYSSFATFQPDPTRHVTRTGESEASKKKNLVDAATRGAAEAYAHLAYCYYNGSLGTVKDLGKSQRLLEDGIAASDALAYFERACAYRFGYYAPADEDRARADYFAAARLGVPRAMTSVGLRLMTGRGVPQDPPLGHLCYMSAAYEGDTDAMGAVAAQFESGYGAARNLEAARVWCRIALAEGSKEVYGTLFLLEGGREAMTAGAPLPAKALGILEEGALAGSLICQRDLGERLVRGNGVPASASRGIAMLENAAARDEFGECHEILGMLYREGAHVPRDLAAAIRYFKLATTRGHQDAWARLAMMHEMGEGTPIDGPETVRCLERSIALGSSIGMYEMGRLHATEKFAPKNMERAIALWRQAAGQQYAHAYRVLGQHLLTGHNGVSVDEAEGLAWIEKAVASGDGIAARSAAQYFRERKDYARERVWLDRGDALGDAGCPNDIGVQHRFGHGVAQDFAKAAEAYKRAAERGNLDGAVNLAWCYETGNGVGKDVGEAFRMQLRTAVAGHPEAMFHTARMYLDGTGVSRDQPSGLQWLVKSAQAGNERAKVLVEAAKAKGLIR